MSNVQSYKLDVNLIPVFYFTSAIAGHKVPSVFEQKNAMNLSRPIVVRRR